jgi:hypothetical protein
MPNSYTYLQAIEYGTLVLLVGREGRGQTYDAMLGIAWSVRNRVVEPKYWGHDWLSVMSHPEAYSSMVPPRTDNDPNLRVYPDAASPKWDLVFQAAEAAYWGVGPDPVQGATHYFDSSMDNNEPPFATAPTSEHIRDIDSLRFFKAQ